MDSVGLVGVEPAVVDAVEDADPAVVVEDAD